MTLINTNVNGYWQQAGIYGGQQRSFTTNAPASQAYKPNNTMPKMDMPSMFKLMLQMVKMLQGMQGQRYGQTQSTYNNAASPYPNMNPADYSKKFLSPSPVATVPTPVAATVNSTAFLFAMLLSQSSGTSSILPNLVSTTPAPPTTTTPSTPSPPVEETLDLPIYTPPPGVYLISGNQYVVSTLEQYVSGTSETTGQQFSSTGLSIPNLAGQANPLANKTYIILESGDQDFILASVDYQATMDTAKTIDFDGKTYDVIFSDTVKRYPDHHGSPLTFDLNGDGVKTSD